MVLLLSPSSFISFWFAHVLTLSNQSCQFQISSASYVFRSVIFSDIWIKWRCSFFSDFLSCHVLADMAQRNYHRSSKLYLISVTDLFKFCYVFILFGYCEGALPMCSIFYVVLLRTCFRVINTGYVCFILFCFFDFVICSLTLGNFESVSSVDLIIHVMLLCTLFSAIIIGHVSFISFLIFIFLGLFMCSIILAYCEEACPMAFSIYVMLLRTLVGAIIIGTVGRSSLLLNFVFRHMSTNARILWTFRCFSFPYFKVETWVGMDVCI